MPRIVGRLQVVAAVLVAVGAARAQTEPVLDRFGGETSVRCAASGFFRTERLGERWWLITPEGHPFFSVGVNVLSFNGTANRDGVYHYGDACRRKYASPEAWATAQVERCRAWGINTVGCWSDWGLFRERLPYTVNLDVGAANWLSGAWIDLFDDSFVATVREKVQQVAAPLKDDPFLIGYYLGNEMKWGPDHRGGHLLDEFFSRPAATATKRALIGFLQQRYAGSLEALRQDLDTPAQTWDELAAASAITVRPTAAATALRLAWAEAVAERFFAVTAAELKAVDPRHLNLGVRFISQMTPPAVLRVAGRYVDVMTINFYDIGNWVQLIRGLWPDYLVVDDDLAQYFAVGGRPILISEWGYRAADSGHPNTWPPIYPVLPDQAARAAAYEALVRRLLARPWFVGHHWFQWADQPREGRFDGENNNFGLVSLDDEPYAPLVERSATLARAAYARLQAEPAGTAPAEPIGRP
jgi:agarase